MSDSDTDVFLDDVIAYPNRSTRVCGKGPNVKTTSCNVQNNDMFTSAMNMHRNMERPRYAASVYDHRSIYNGRETSPVSFHSASGIHLRNLHHSYYPGGMSSQRSTYNGRNGSEMSVRTIDSNTSATDIAKALRTTKFNKFDIKIINEAFTIFKKRGVRKRIEKRRKLRMFLKGYRRKSGGDSGDQASNSSLSSDDHRSVRSSRTATFNDANCRSNRTNFMDLRNTMKQSGMYRDCTDDLRQNRFPNMLSGPTRCMQENLPPRLNNTSLMSENSRFTHGFLLPSQRFNANQYVASLPEMPYRDPQIINNQIINGIQTRNQNTFYQNRDHNRKLSHKAISEQEEIFSEITVMQKNNETKSQRKRALEEEDITPFGRKKNKLSTPVKKIMNLNIPKAKQTGSKANNQGSNNNFIFAKPQLPVKKPASVKKLNVKPQQVSIEKSKSLKTCGTITSKTQTPKNVPKPKQQETLISKSQAPMEEIISQTQTSKETVDQSPEKLISKSSQPLDLEQQRTQNLPPINYEKDQHEMTHSTTDISMRPSFIKRKLFTQNVDETENSGSSESLQTQSPQSNIYSKIQKERNKARKLVTQSCLSRDLGDNSNLLDLIHKIVPPDRMNLTKATNKSEIQINKSKSRNSDKWDITAIINTNKSKELSDTYTDDEIFKNDETKQNHAKIKQNDVKENNNKKNVNKNQAANNKISTLKTINKQSKPLKKNSEKAETNKKTDITDINNTTKNCQKRPSNACKVLLQKMAPQTVTQMLNVKSLQSNNVPTDMEMEDQNKKTTYCIQKFWNESDSDYSATPQKKPELKEKGLTNSPAMNHTVSNQRNNTQNEIPIRQVVTAKTSLTTNVIVHPAQSKNKKITDDAPDKGKVTQSNEKTPEKLQVNKNVKVQVQLNKEKTVNNGLKSKQIETNKKTYAKPTPSDTKIKTSSKEENIIKINNTLHIRSLRTPKINKSFTDDKSNDTVNTSNDSQLCRTLRSRVINLSTSLDKENSPKNKNTALKNKKKSVKNKNVAKLSDKENISKTSDQSLTLSSETPLATKLVPIKRAYKVNSRKLKVTKSRLSDVSFTLSKKVLNHKTTNTRKPKEVEKLQLDTLKVIKSGKKSPLNKVESTRLNKSRSSARLNRSKVY